MTTSARNASESTRHTRWLPRPLWMGLLLPVLLMVAAGLSLGLPIIREQIAIREIERLRGRISRVPSGPEWIRNLIGDERMEPFDDVDIVDFSFAQAVAPDAPQVSDSDLACLRGRRGLRELSLWNTPVTGSGLAYLKDIPRLRSLILGRELSAGELVHLEKLTSLQELHLSGPGVSDAGLAHLRPLTQLRVVLLGDPHITDAGIAHLEGLVEMRLLQLSATGITDAGLEHLKRMSKLERLGLCVEGISDAGLSHLLGLSNLRYVNLHGTRVTDVSVLKKLPLLEEVNLEGTDVTDASIAELKAALPKVRAVRRFLLHRKIRAVPVNPGGTLRRG